METMNRLRRRGNDVKRQRCFIAARDTDALGSCAHIQSNIVKNTSFEAVDMLSYPLNQDSCMIRIIYWSPLKVALRVAKTFSRAFDLGVPFFFFFSFKTSTACSFRILSRSLQECKPLEVEGDAW